VWDRAQIKDYFGDKYQWEFFQRAKNVAEQFQLFVYAILAFVYDVGDVAVQADRFDALSLLSYIAQQQNSTVYVFSGDVLPSFDNVQQIFGKPQDLERECEYIRRPSVASLHQLAVEPSLQGKGIGRALIAACERWARESGFAELALDTAEPATHLVALYARLGFAQVDTVQWPGKCCRSVMISKRLVGG
jgi:GNAT superfamily N-acetyltransferase